MYLWHILLKAHLAFDTPNKLQTLWQNTYIDIKKTGVFPIVQGIRSLAFRKN